MAVTSSKKKKKTNLKQLYIGTIWPQDQTDGYCVKGHKLIVNYNYL